MEAGMTRQALTVNGPDVDRRVPLPGAGLQARDGGAGAASLGRGGYPNTARWSACPLRRTNLGMGLRADVPLPALRV